MTIEDLLFDQETVWKFALEEVRRTAYEQAWQEILSEPIKNKIIFQVRQELYQVDDLKKYNPELTDADIEWIKERVNDEEYRIDIEDMRCF